MKLKYGRGVIKFDLDESKVSKVLLANEKKGLDNPLKVVEESIKNPIGSLPLGKLVQEKSLGKFVIIVNDVTRPTPYNYMLPPVLDELHKKGVKKEQITFVIATGVHDPHTEKQNEEMFGKEIVENYRFIFHDCDDPDLVNLGELSSGNTLYVNKEVIEADFIITLGVILPHYFAGFSGGRKSILPGVSGRQTIEFNHARMVKLMGNLPPIKENPVNLEMIEAARKVGVDFILNVVTNSHREIVKVVAGDLEEAWYSGISTSAAMYHVDLEEKVDVAIVSPGGYPRDINVYQTQKALDHADHGTKAGGTIILLAECEEGYGEKVFEEWMDSADKPEQNVDRIKKRFVIGGHKAFAVSKVAINKEVIIISSLSQEASENLFTRKMDNIEEALSYVADKYDNNYKAIVMPQGSLTVPVVK